MKTFLLIASILFTCLTASFAQENAGESDSTYTRKETMPEYPVGQDALMEYLSAIKYPKSAVRKSLVGDVYVKFIIDKEGKVTDVSIARTSGHKIIDDAAVKHISKMKDWAPGTQEGKQVSVEYVIPLKFNISQ